MFAWIAIWLTTELTGRAQKNMVLCLLWRHKLLCNSTYVSRLDYSPFHEHVHCISFCHAYLWAAVEGCFFLSRTYQHCIVKAWHLRRLGVLTPRFNAEIVRDVAAKARVILLLFQSELSFYWSRWPADSLVIRVKNIVCVVSSIPSFSDHRPCLERSV